MADEDDGTVGAVMKDDDEGTSEGALLLLPPIEADMEPAELDVVGDDGSGEDVWVSAEILVVL